MALFGTDVKTHIPLVYLKTEAEDLQLAAGALGCVCLLVGREQDNRR